MTTKVIIISSDPNHQDVLVEQYSPQTGNVYSNAKRLTEGESVEIYVHSSVALRITEIPKVAKVEEVKAE
jgi:hypothetical protein